MRPLFYYLCYIFPLTSVCSNFKFSPYVAAFGLGSMVYNGMELGSFFEIPWNSPCYQVLRGINPILQMIFTFSQLYFVFMNARVRRKENSHNPSLTWYGCINEF